MQLLLGHAKLDNTIRYLGIEIDDALELAQQTEAQQVHCGRHAATALRPKADIKVISGIRSASDPKQTSVYVVVAPVGSVVSISIAGKSSHQVLVR